MNNETNITIKYSLKWWVRPAVSLTAIILRVSQKGATKDRAINYAANLIINKGITATIVK